MGLKVLVLEAHVDDADCGCGSTIFNHIKNGDEVQWHTFISEGYKVPDGWAPDVLIKEAQAARAYLGVKDYTFYDFTVDTLDRATELRDLIFHIWHNFEPDIAYVPLRRSRHQDHRAIGDYAWQVAWRSHADIFAYPVLNDFDDFTPNVFSLIGSEALQAKILALEAYHSQFKLRAWFTIDLVRAFMQKYAVFVDGDYTYVEPFEQVKRVLT